MMTTIYLQGGDSRFDLLGERALQSGFRVYKKMPENMEKSAIFIFDPREKIKNILTIMKKAAAGSVFLMWKTDPQILALAKEKRFIVKGFSEDENYLSKNAVETAEGVLANVIEKTDRCLSELCILIYGYGNCGKEIAKLLWLCGCEVFIWSREKGCKRALDDGFNVYPAPNKGLFMFDGIVNTVPENIFPPSFLFTMRPKTHFFQVASGNSGISEKFLEEIGVFYHDLHGLPGKFSPATEADALWEIFKKALSEEKERKPI